MSNYYKNTGTKISEYPNAPINSKYFKGKFDNTHYFISYAPTNYGITSINKNFKVSINALRTDMLGYIGLQNAKGNWQDYIVIWQGDWYNEDKKNSYLYQWNIGQISSRHYIRNKHGLDKNDKGELLDVINNTKRVFLLNNAPLPLEQGEYVDPNPHNHKIVDKKYIDDRFNGIRKVSVNNQTIQIRPYTCLYEVSTTNKVSISDTLTLSDGRSIKDCIKDNCLIFYVKLPENTSGIDGVTWSYPLELNDVKKSVGGSLVKCYAEYIDGQLNVRCTNAMNAKPTTGGSGGGIEYVSGNYIDIDVDDNSINLKYDTEIAAGSSGIPTSQAVYAVTSNKLDLSTFNGHISDFNEHINSIDKDDAIHMGETARLHLSVAYDHAANESTFYNNHLASGDKDKLNYSYSTVASLASDVASLNSSSKNWNATSTLVGDNYSNWNWAYTTVSENYSKWDAKSDIQVTENVTDDPDTVPTTKAVYDELTNKLNTSMFNTHVNEFNTHVNGFNTHVNEFNRHVNEDGLHLTYALNHNISQAYGHLTSELYSSIHVSDEDRTKWNGFEERINELASLGLSYKILEEGEELPEPSENYSGCVYLTKNSQSENNSYDEWICVIIDGDNTSCAYDDVYKWEQIGSTEIDLTDYVTNSDFKNHTDNTNIHVTKEEKDRIDEQISTITTIISSIDSNVDVLNKAVDDHTGDDDIHVTSEDKENWNKISELNNYVTNTTFNSHTSNNTEAKHVTEEEKENWNSKIDNVKSGQYIEVTDNNKVSVITSREIINDSTTIPTTKAVHDYVNDQRIWDLNNFIYECLRKRGNDSSKYEWVENYVLNSTNIYIDEEFETKKEWIEYVKAGNDPYNPLIFINDMFDVSDSSSISTSAGYSTIGEFVKKMFRQLDEDAGKEWMTDNSFSKKYLKTGLSIKYITYLSIDGNNSDLPRPTDFSTIASLNSDYVYPSYTISIYTSPNFSDSIEAGQFSFEEPVLDYRYFSFDSLTTNKNWNYLISEQEMKITRNYLKSLISDEIIENADVTVNSKVLFDTLVNKEDYSKDVTVDLITVIDYDYTYESDTSGSINGATGCYGICFVPKTNVKVTSIQMNEINNEGGTSATNIRNCYIKIFAKDETGAWRLVANSPEYWTNISGPVSITTGSGGSSQTQNYWSNKWSVQGAGINQGSDFIAKEGVEYHILLNDDNNDVDSYGTDFSIRMTLYPNSSNEYVLGTNTNHNFTNYTPNFNVYGEEVKIDEQTERRNLSDYTIPTEFYGEFIRNKHDISHKYDKTNNVVSFNDGNIKFSDGTERYFDIQKAVIAKYLFRGDSSSTITEFNTREHFNTYTKDASYRNDFYYEYDVFDTYYYNDFDASTGRPTMSTLQNVINGTNLFIRSQLSEFNDDLSCLMNGFQMFLSSTKLTTFRSALPSLTCGIRMFNGCSSLNKFETKLPNLALAECMFKDNKSLTEINTCLPNLTHAQGMFGGCSNLSKIRFSKNSFQCLYNAQDMFISCSSLTSFHYELPYLETADDMFAGCKLDLESVKIIAESLPSFGVKGQDGCAEDDRKHVITFGVADGVAAQATEYKTLMENKGWVVEGI